MSHHHMNSLIGNLRPWIELPAGTSFLETVYVQGIPSKLPNY